MNTGTSFVPAAGFRLAIIGGCGGMGRALVRLACELHFELTIMDLERSIAEHPPPDGVLSLACDVSSEEQVQQAFASIGSRWGAIDGFVNLAGYTGERIRVEDMSSAEWDAILNTDLRGMFLSARAAAPLLRASAAQARSPAAVLVSSTFGVRVPHVGYGPYAASKAGVIGMARSITRELGSRSITANVVAPGFIESPMTDALNDKQKEGILASVPAGKLGQGADIAAAVVYLASAEAGYVTGQTLHVNGGMARI